MLLVGAVAEENTRNAAEHERRNMGFGYLLCGFMLFLEIGLSAGGGVVKLKINGKKEILSVNISPEVVDPDDIETLEDLIVAAVSDLVAGAVSIDRSLDIKEPERYIET